MTKKLKIQYFIKIIMLLFMMIYKNFISKIILIFYQMKLKNYLNNIISNKKSW